MNGFLAGSLGRFLNIGWLATVLLAVAVGWDWGAERGSPVWGVLLGLVGGIVLATVVFGLIGILLGIHRTATELLLVQRHGPERADAILRAAAAAPGFLGASSTRILSWVTNAYLVVFFAYMFLPLLIMVAAAFNESRSPAISPWQGFTLDWFARLADKDQLWAGLWSSLVIGACVVVLAVVLGLAGALLITHLHSRVRTFAYALLVSPVLTPGVILGISTLLLWQEAGLAGGIFVTVIAQSSFIAAYAMLLFMARLQRFDPVLEEAALDLGASHRQVFWKVTLPFLRPTVLTAAVLAFLQSFENYNTTLFTIGREVTLTIFIGSAVRQGQEPTINALAVIFIGLTVVAAIAYEAKRRAERMRAEMAREAAKRADARMIATRATPAGVPAEATS